MVRPSLSARRTAYRMLCAALAALLGGSSVACGSSDAKKVLLIGLDGVRVDILAEAETPNIDALIANGTFSEWARTGTPTVSGPGWSSMLTGVWPEKHGVHGNDFAGNAYDKYPDFLTRLERIDPAFQTFAVVDWPPLGTERSGGPLLSRGIDVLRVLDGDEMGYEVADSQSVAIAVNHLTSADPDAVFVYLGAIDVVGHATSSLAPEYRAAIERADGWVGELVRAVLARPTYDREDWLILMSTDHGRRDDGGHGGLSPNERTIFYLASGPSARKGTPVVPPGIVDVAVTALAHLGVEIDRSWGLDGRIVGLAGR